MMRTYQLVGWWSPQWSGSMGDMLNLGWWQWVSMEYHSYEFLEGHICVVAYCNVELAVCILFVVYLYSYPGFVTASFPSSGSGPSLLYYSQHIGGHIGRNVVEITIKMKTIVRKPLMIKINKLGLRDLDN